MCIKKLRVLFLGWFLAGLLYLPSDLWAHEIVGEVTPLMIHMKRALLLIGSDKEKEAVHEIHMVYEDFSHDMGMNMVMVGTGLKETVADIDKRYKTELGLALSRALEKDDAQALKKIVQDLAYLLMLEKFEALHSTFGKRSTNLEAQKTMFWLGRNYFSYLLEPDLALRDPIEEQRLDRLLDRMLYRLEDGEAEEFVVVQKELMKGLVTAFHLDLSTLMHTGSISGDRLTPGSVP
ncbi:MAG: hypothetical protein ACREIQ_09255 [Nitrospiria bacterium]